MCTCRPTENGNQLEMCWGGSLQALRVTLQCVSKKSFAQSQTVGVAKAHDICNESKTTVITVTHMLQVFTDDKAVFLNKMTVDVL